MTVEQAFQIAVQHHQAGRLNEAEGIYRQILGVDSNHHRTLHLLGVLAHQVHRNDIAPDSIQRAIQLSPSSPDYHSNLAMVLSSTGRHAEAAASARAALALQPRYADAQVNLGYALAMLGQADEAVNCFREAILIDPKHAQAHSNLGKTLHGQGMLQEAIAELRRAVQLQPGRADFHNALGIALDERGNTVEAVAAFRNAIAINPRFTDAQNNLGLALHGKHQYDEAIASYRAAMAIDSTNPRILNNLGNALRDTGDLAAGMALLRQAADLSPADPTPHSNLIYAMHFQLGVDQREMLAEERRWSAKYAAPIRSLIKPHTNDRDPHRKLRIGYVSPDFRDHCQSFFTLPLLQNHDRSNFEVTCYSNVSRPDSVTEQIQRQGNHWRDISRVSDRQAAEMVREDEIDILIDLTLHMSANRLLLFAHKPAPVQVSWLGYPGSTGLETIDYRFSDPYLDPPGLDDTIYSERTIRLSNSFWCYAPPSDEPAVGPLPALTNRHITFGCLNSFNKINDSVLALWSKVLLAIPDSRMIILADPGAHRGRTLETLGKMGIHPERITFEAERPRAEYLDLYNRIDIALDTFPANGHTTTMDALWMGVPVITRPGATAISRGSLSILHNIGLPELAAASEEEFIDIARRLSRDSEKLSSMRSSMRDRMRQSPLMDGPRFAKDFEQQLRMIWQEWCAAPANEIR